ncbi:Uncharacterized protein TCM_019530 [Theobroma cacao]|uniref:Uncharacterized protein n=1 Tax=Theobroma cacao TaxID=3641 RepID=A0A061EGZ9_THECC|nr:Uncharacterized protein TCM_019530 [Theobroma cacao]
MEADSSGAPPTDADGNQGREAVRVGSKRGRDDTEAMPVSKDSEDEDRLLEDFESDEDEFRSDIENLCPVRQKETEGFSEEQATKLASEKKNLVREHESTPYGPWMVAKKTYRRNSGNRTEGGTKSKLKMLPQIGTSKEVAKPGSRFYILVEEGNTLDDEEFVPETMLRGDTKKVLNKPEKIVTAVQKKQNLKESLQEATNVSNRNPTLLASKGTLVTSLVPKTVSSETDIRSNEKIQARENNVALMGSNGMAIQRNSQALVEIALASQTRMETIPITASFPIPQQKANVGKIGVGINGVARERECLKKDEGSHIRTEHLSSSVDMDLEIGEEDIMQV